MREKKITGNEEIKWNKTRERKKKLIMMENKEWKKTKRTRGKSDDE